ncbi:MAG: hypothetical protein JNJ46_28120 [Myxococcales bacterium]|nr:hypothetical protein [Myxococcales bacterium]
MSADIRDIARAEALARIRRPAQGMFDELLFPWSIRDLLQETDADYERINLQAKGRPDWDVEYTSWKTFYQANKDPGWLSSSQETAQAIRRRQARLVEWQKLLAQRGVQTGPQGTVSGPAPLFEAPSSDRMPGLERVAKWAAGTAVLYLASRALGLGEKMTSRRKGSSDG